MRGCPKWKIGAVSLGVALGAVFAASCSAEGPEPAVLAGSPVPMSASSLEPDKGMEALQSRQEAEMVRIFRFLIRLDEIRETSLSRVQAEAMLPIVTRSVQEGILGDQEKAALIKLFRAEQWAAYNRFMTSGKPPPEDSLGPEEAEDEKRRRMEEWMKEADGERGNRHPPAGDWGAGEKNVEQQLMELLQVKLAGA